MNKEPLFSDITDQEIEDLFANLWRDEEEVTCECGAEAVYGKDTTTHSSWCPKNRETKKT